MIETSRSQTLLYIFVHTLERSLIIMNFKLNNALKNEALSLTQNKIYFSKQL